MIHYAGIGTRVTPPAVLERMTNIGMLLAMQGFVLRSGGARGADRAFEEGAVTRSIRRELDEEEQAVPTIFRIVVETG